MLRLFSARVLPLPILFLFPTYFAVGALSRRCGVGQFMTASPIWKNITSCLQLESVTIHELSRSVRRKESGNYEGCPEIVHLMVMLWYSE